MQNWRISSDGVVLAGMRIPATRGQLMLLMVALNEAFLGLDILLAHGLDGNIRPNEWIPILFGPAAAAILVIAGVIALRRRRLAVLLALGVFVVSLIVGLVGAYFHVQRAIPPSGLGALDVTLAIFVFAPPVVGPLTFSLVAVLGVIAAMYEDPPDSGTMIAPGLFRWRVPFSQTQQYCIWIGLGILATLLSSVLDHGRFNFENAWVWLPTVVGVFATVCAIAIGVLKQPSRADWITYTAAMIALIAVGVIGFFLHVDTGLATGGVIVPERFLRGAPVLAPLLFADMAAFGLLVLYPVEDRLSDLEEGAGEPAAA